MEPLVIGAGAIVGIASGYAITRAFPSFFPNHNTPRNRRVATAAGGVFAGGAAAQGTRMALRLYRYSPATFNLAARIAFLSLLAPAALLCIYLYRNQKTVLVKGEEVPEKWHNDPLLSIFICTISQSPAVTAIRDRQAKGLYDRNWIAAWLRRSESSPLTRNAMPKWELVTQKLYAVSGLIHFRLRQLKEIEAKDKDTFELRQKETADSLSLEVETFLKMKDEEIASLKAIPEFLKDFPGIPNCRITGKPVLLPLSINLPEEEIQKTDEKLFDLYFERSAVDEHLLTKPHEAPEGWPIKLFPLPLKSEYFKSNRSKQRDIHTQVIKARNELAEYYSVKQKKTE